jgi:purine-binding chemotaxis protein CheW
MTSVPQQPQEPAALDWEAIRTRLQRLSAAAGADVEPAPEQAQAVLEARARDLARVPAVAPDTAAVLTLVAFALGAEPYALETRFVRRVVRSSEVSLTPIPGTPEILVGVINMGGEILAVFDLGRFFGLHHTARTEQSRILVLGTERDEFGLLADAASEVHTVPNSSLLEPPATFEGLGRNILRGVTADALIVLDGAALLREPRLVVDQGEEAGP